MYNSLDAYIVITKKLVRQAKQFLPLDTDKIHLLYYGIPTPDKFNQDNCLLSQLELADEKFFRVGLFGRIEYGKGQHLLLDALSQLTKAGLNIRVYIIGHIMDDKYFNNLMKRSNEEHLDDKFIHIGFHENPMSIMPCFDVITLTSYSETFGLVLIEAMRSGVAVIGTNSGGVPEIIKHESTGLLFEPGNATQLAKSIETLYKKPNVMKSIANEGKKFADQKFSDKTHFETLASILKMVKID